jgi:stress-induced morphogen
MHYSVCYQQTIAISSEKSVKWQYNIVAHAFHKTSRVARSSLVCSCAETHMASRYVPSAPYHYP